MDEFAACRVVMCDPINGWLKRLFQWFYDELDDDTRNMLWEKCQHVRREYFKINCGSALSRTSFAVAVFWYIYKIFYHKPVKFYGIYGHKNKIIRRIVDYDFIRRNKRNLHRKPCNSVFSRYYHMEKYKKIKPGVYLVYWVTPMFKYVDRLIEHDDFISLSGSVPNQTYKKPFKKILFPDKIFPKKTVAEIADRNVIKKKREMENDLGIDDVASIIGVSEKIILKYADRGDIDFIISKNGEMKFRKADVKKFIKKRKDHIWMRTHPDVKPPVKYIIDVDKLLKRISSERKEGRKKKSVKIIDGKRFRIKTR